MNRSNRSNPLNGTGPLLAPAILLLALGACGDEAPRAMDAGTGTVPSVAGMPMQQAAATTATVLQAAPEGVARMRFNRVRIMDDSAGAQQPAYTAQVPDTWRTAGGVQWDDSAPCHADQVRVSWSARSPDGASVFQILPDVGWQVAGTENRADPCPVAGYRSARDLLEAAAAQARPQARVLDYQDWSEKIARMQRKMAEDAAGLAPGQELRVDAGHLLLGYAENGIEMREVLTVAVNFASRNGNTIASTRQFTSYRAPNGQLEFALNDRIAGSLEPDQQWVAASSERKVRNVQRYLEARRAGNRQ